MAHGIPLQLKGYLFADNLSLDMADGIPPFSFKIVKKYIELPTLAVSNSQEACSCFHLIPDQGTSHRTQPKSSQVAVQ